MSDLHDPNAVDFDCLELGALLPLYVDGEFQDGERSAIEQHLAVCASCSRQVHALRAFKNSVARAVLDRDAMQVPAGLNQRIRRRTQRARAARSALRLAAPASAAAVLIGFFTVATGNAYSPIVAESVQRHMDNARVDYASPSPSRIERALHRHLKSPLRVPIFQSPQVALRGARLVRLQNRPAAYLVYGTARSKISVFAMPDPDDRFAPHDERLAPADSTQPLLVERRNGYNVIVWRQRGTLYSMVSDLDAREVLSLLQNVPSTPFSGRQQAAPEAPVRRVTY